MLGIAFPLLVNVIPVIKCDTPFSYIDSHDLDLENPVINDLLSTACQHVPHASSDNPLNVIFAVKLVALQLRALRYVTNTALKEIITLFSFYQLLIAQQLSQGNTGNLELTNVLQLMMKAFIASSSHDKRLGFINKNIAFIEPQEVFIQNFFSKIAH